MFVSRHQRNHGTWLQEYTRQFQHEPVVSHHETNQLLMFVCESYDVSVAVLPQVILVFLLFSDKACARPDVYEQPTWSRIGLQQPDNW